MRKFSIPATICGLVVSASSISCFATTLVNVDQDGNVKGGKITSTQLYEVGLLVSSSSTFCTIPYSNYQGIDVTTLVEQIKSDKVEVVTCTFGKPFKIDYRK